MVEYLLNPALEAAANFNQLLRYPQDLLRVVNSAVAHSYEQDRVISHQYFLQLEPRNPPGEYEQPDLVVLN